MQTMLLFYIVGKYILGKPVRNSFDFTEQYWIMKTKAKINCTILLKQTKQ